MDAIPHLGEALALGAALSWSVAVILFKQSGEGMPPLALNLFKNAFAVLLLTPTAALTGDALLPPLPGQTWLLLATSGVLGIAVADSLFFAALHRLGAGMSAVVDTSYAPILLALSYFWLGERLGPRDLAGAGLIVAALLVATLTRPPRDRTRRDLWEGTALGVGSMVTMGVAVVMIKPVLETVPLIWATWVRLVAGGLGCAFLVGLSPRRRALLASLRPSPTWRTALPATFFGTYLAMVMWVGGMKYTLVSRAALLNQLSSVFIFVLATVFLKEPLTPRRAAALCLAVVGAVLVVS